MRALLPLGLLLALALPAAAQPADLGETTFPNSGAAEAQEPFLRGLLLLHSFEYADAREAFQEAQRRDPAFAMAYWGEALTHNHPIWMEQDREAALEALGRLGPTPEARRQKAPTERERDYLRALDALFGEGEKEARDHAYAEAMAALAARYPDDLDAAAFHALALLGTAHGGRDFATYMRAAAVAEEVFDRNPRHPGAAHYLIHAYDDPVHAPLGLRAARAYAEIAPAASHALHMPSHIYVALGMWDEAAEMNRRAFEAAQARDAHHGEHVGGHGWHALYWRAYAELQRGRYAEAARLLGLARDLHAGAPDRRALVHLAFIRANVVVETGDWSGEAARMEIPRGDAALSAPVRDAFVVGWAALKRGERPAAEAALADVRSRLDATGAAEPAARAAALQLEALLALDAGDTDGALALLEQAAALEDAMPFDFGPPDPVKPVHELWGEVLLEADRPAEAQAHFERALERYPRRARALLGLARAAAAAGDAAAAYAAYDALHQAWAAADPAAAAQLEAMEGVLLELSHRSGSR